MKEITKERVVKEVVCYEANDGTRFSDRDECRKYENSALNVVKVRFKKLVIGITNECCLMDTGCEDGDWYIVEIKNRDDVNTIAMYGSLIGYHGDIVTDDDIGKEVIIGTYGDDDIWRAGTLDEIIDRIRKSYMKTKEMYEKEKRS